MYMSTSVYREKAVVLNRHSCAHIRPGIRLVWIELAVLHKLYTHQTVRFSPYCIIHPTRGCMHTVGSRVTLSMGCVYMCTTRLYRDRAYSGPKGESGDLYGVPVCQCPWLIAIVGHYTFFMAISVLTRLWKVFKGGRWMAHLTSSAYRSIPHTNCPGRVVIDGVSAPIGVQTHACTVYLCTYPLYVHILCLYTLIYTYIHTSMYLYCIDFVWSPRIAALLGAHCGRDRGGLGGRAYREWAPLAGPTLRPLRDPLTVLLWTALCGVGTCTCQYSTGWWMRG